MTVWQVVRHQVAIAGRVDDADSGKPVGGADVAITAMPAAFKKRLESPSRLFGSRGSSAAEALDRTRTRADGIFYFMDLPDGKYSLSASLPGCGKRYGTVHETAQVSRDAKGAIKMIFVSFKLQPTVLSGKITGAGQKSGLIMAEVRVKGSGERAFSDARGEYRLAAIEPGKRTVVVFAQGYRAVTQAVTFKQPGELQTVNFSLVRETGER